MKNTALALLVLALAAGPAAGQGKETETVDRTLAFSPGGTLKLNNFSGNVHITGTGDSSVKVHAVRRATRERLENILLDIQVSGSTIEIEANRKAPGWSEKNDNVVETEFQIEVPAGTPAEPAQLLRRLDRARDDGGRQGPDLQRQHRPRPLDSGGRSRNQSRNVQRRHLDPAASRLERTRHLQQLQRRFSQRLPGHAESEVEEATSRRTSAVAAARTSISRRSAAT